MSLRTRLVLTVVGVVALAVGGCSSSSGGTGDIKAPTTGASTSSAAPSTPPPTSSAPTTAPATTAAPTTAAPVAQGCPPTGAGVPAGAASRQVIDVDGDGRADTVWLMTADAPARLGMTTASGATFVFPITFAGGSEPSGIVADVTGNGSQIIAFAFNSRVVDLLRIVNCSFTVVTNPQGQPYTFDLGFSGYGTGVGCVDANGDGVRDLVGLNIVRNGAGQPSAITRTIITMQGTAAANGQTYNLPVNPAALASASTVTCGDATVDSAGVSRTG
ncbi:MAG: uncharacterized protein JWN61_209 [Pseudonocardiales bacterium]|nr:uncharacterized protein [Jatrophihabitantaceae bacterium]MCW2602074.1 uncharacterized protein [Pseudonocardiales bacterium]